MDRAFLAKNNLEYSRTLAHWCFAGNRHFHYASSAAVYGDGAAGYNDSDDLVHRYHALNPYGESKLLFDQWLVDSKLTDKVVGFRYFNVFGPNEYHKGDMRSMVSKAYDQWKSGGKVRLFANTRAGRTNGSEERDFVYVKDVCEVMAWFLENPDKRGVFNLGTGKARTFLDLVSAVFAALGASPNIDYIPMPDKLRNQYQYFTQADMTKLGRAGYSKPFTSLEAAVSDYVANYLNKNHRPL
jgi:ADP-L-glycero-D-manno-heptose 6-epimerase